MRVAVTGASGFVGSALCASLAADGHDVLRLVRRPATSNDEVEWDPAAGRVDLGALNGVEGVVNLAGPGVGDRRWTRSYKKTLRDTRVAATTTIAAAMTQLDPLPRVLVSVVGINIYGDDRGRDFVTENDPAGTSFLARLCVDWEAATDPAREAGIAVATPRMGIVLGRHGGALKSLLPLARFGLIGPMGGGEQFWSYVSIQDAVRALRFLLEEPGLVGPFNVVTPEPVSNAELMRVIGHHLNRPAFLPIPGFGLQVVLGGYASVLLGSLRAIPERLLEFGFTFEHPDARSAVGAGLAS